MAHAMLYEKAYFKADLKYKVIQGGRQYRAQALEDAVHPVYAGGVHVRHAAGIHSSLFILIVAFLLSDRDQVQQPYATKEPRK